MSAPSTLHMSGPKGNEMQICGMSKSLRSAAVAGWIPWQVDSEQKVSVQNINEGCSRDPHPWGKGRKQGEAEGEIQLQCSHSKTAADPVGRAEAGWPFRVALSSGKGVGPFYLPVGQSLDAGFPREECDLGSVAFFSSFLKRADS